MHSQSPHTQPPAPSHAADSDEPLHPTRAEAQPDCRVELPAPPPPAANSGAPLHPTRAEAQTHCRVDPPAPPPVPADSDEPLHPGTHLKHLLRQQNMTSKILALRVGVSNAHLSNVLNGKKPISVDLAYSIDFVLGIDYFELLTMQSIYEKRCLDLVEEQKITPEELALAGRLKTELPFFDQDKALVEAKSAHELVLTLRRYFKISNLQDVTTLLQELLSPPAEVLQAKPYYTMGLLNMFNRSALSSINSAAYKTAGIFDHAKLKATLPALKALKAEGASINRASKPLKECGIIVRYARNSKAIPFYAYLKRLQPGKLLIYLTEKNRTVDHYWSTLFALLEKVLNGEVKVKTGLALFQGPGEQQQP